MGVLYERSLRSEKVITLNTREARALEDPVRAAILDLLSVKPMSVEELKASLEERGYVKSINTIRHHVGVLKEAGLVDLVRVEEARGAVLKYYGARARLLTGEVEVDVEKLREPLEFLESRLRRDIASLLEKYGRVIDEEASRLKPCPYCQTIHFREYIVAKLVEAALARIISSGMVRRG